MNLRETLRDLATSYIKAGPFQLKLWERNAFFPLPSVVLDHKPYGLRIHFLKSTVGAWSNYKAVITKDKPNLRKLISITSKVHLYLEIRRDVKSRKMLILTPGTYFSKDKGGYEASLCWIRAGISLRYGSRTNPTDPSQEGL